MVDFNKIFNNWNIVKHTSMSIIFSLAIGSISYFIIKPDNLSSSIGIIGGEGQTAIYTNFGFDAVINIIIGISNLTICS